MAKSLGVEQGCLVLTKGKTRGQRRGSEAGRDVGDLPKSGEGRSGGIGRGPVKMATSRKGFGRVGVKRRKRDERSWGDGAEGEMGRMPQNDGERHSRSVTNLPYPREERRNGQWIS